MRLRGFGRPNEWRQIFLALNAVFAHKLSITTPRPQTTRGLIHAVFTQGNGQAVFVDTPGAAERIRNPLNRIMHRQLLQGIAAARLAVFVVDAARQDEKDFVFLRELAKNKVTTLAALNKIDRLKDKNTLFPFATLLQEKAKEIALDLRDIFPLSARTGEGVEALSRRVMELLPEAPFAYQGDRQLLSTESFMVCELLREQLFRCLTGEVPFSLCVLCDSFEKKAVFHISLAVLVTKENHKPILLGKEGKRMKEAASAARRSMEEFLGTQVMLKVRVRVDKNWRGNAQLISEAVLDAKAEI